MRRGKTRTLGVFRDARANADILGRSAIRKRRGLDHLEAVAIG